MPISQTPASNPQRSQTSMQDALRRAMRDEAGRAALRVSPGRQPESQRLVFALLRDVANVKGGSLLEITPEDWLLTELPSHEAVRLQAMLVRILGEGAADLLPFPESKPVLAGLLTAPKMPQFLDLPPAEPVSLTGFDSQLDRLNLAQVFRRQSIVGISDPSMPKLVFQRLTLDGLSLQHAMAPYSEDRALLSHARSLMQKSLLEALGDEGTRTSVLGGGPIAPLLIDLSSELVPSPQTSIYDTTEPATARALYATLPLHEAVTLGNLAARREALSREAWGIAVSGLCATTLTLVDAEILPVDWLILNWSPTLENSGPLKALRRLEADRLILDGCDGEAALAWGLSRGIQLYGGPWIEDIVAAGRMDGCSKAALCTRAECRARGLATSPSGRVGCHMPHLLEAVLPSPLS